mmetsp:Transcript_6752/g.17195  ORF Transcript_6752/g.17195 Transcript_6752/m.17195 type:complete len:336 (+) Transcript_6752:226-1233(+)
MGVVLLVSTVMESVTYVLSWLVFIPLEILWIPAQICGCLWVAYKQIYVSKKMGLSMTAIEVINNRWIMDLFGMRSDPATLCLVKVLPNTSIAGLFVTLIPFWVKWKICGKLEMFPRNVELGKESMMEIITGRTPYFDQVIARVLPKVEQFVVLGAGYDTRSYSKVEGVTVFEVDQTEVQNHKRQMVAAAGIAHDHVNFVPINFLSDKIFDKLIAAGYDPARRTLFLCEGVTMYLTEDAVRETIRQVRDQSPSGSTLLIDLYSTKPLDKLAKTMLCDAMLSSTNENFDFSLPLEKDWENTLQAFAHSEAMDVGQTFFMGSDNKQGPFMVVAELLVR